jgi:hypothetical protein
VVLIEHSHPTLKPEVTGGNEALVEAALGDSHLDIPEAVPPQAVHELFRSARKAAAGRAAVPAGPGARHKGEFALKLAARIAKALHACLKAMPWRHIPVADSARGGAGRVPRRIGRGRSYRS